MTTTFHIPDACCQPEVRDWTIDTILSRRPVTYAELDAIARSMPYKPYDQFNTITDTHKLWKFAIHEAGHSVIGIRGGGTMVYAGVFEEDNGKWMELIGLCRQKASPVRRAAQDNYLAAGYFAGQRWGNEPRRDFSETNDYEVLSRGRTPEEA